jgi:hypothetical protein
MFVSVCSTDRQRASGLAADFFTIEAWTPRGLQRFIVLFLIELSTRRVEIAGDAPTANGLWMNQIGRNLTDAGDGILKGKRYLIDDRDPLFTDEFLKVLGENGVVSVKWARSAILRPENAVAPNVKRSRPDRGGEEEKLQSSPVSARLHALAENQSSSRTLRLTALCLLASARFRSRGRIVEWPQSVGQGLPRIRPPN